MPQRGHPQQQPAPVLGELHPGAVSRFANDEEQPVAGRGPRQLLDRIRPVCYDRAGGAGIGIVNPDAPAVLVVPGRRQVVPGRRPGGEHLAAVRGSRQRLGERSVAIDGADHHVPYITVVAGVGHGPIAATSWPSADRPTAPISGNRARAAAVTGPRGVSFAVMPPAAASCRRNGRQGSRRGGGRSPSLRRQVAERVAGVSGQARRGRDLGALSRHEQETGQVDHDVVLIGAQGLGGVGGAGRLDALTSLLVVALFQPP